MDAVEGNRETSRAGRRGSRFGKRRRPVGIVDIGTVTASQKYSPNALIIPGKKSAYGRRCLRSDASDDVFFPWELE